ncbi:NADP-retinol dehydrogenase [Trifolium repens]|nr:NADP-retinol dehydrogenase [Trifolium repens]
MWFLGWKGASGFSTSSTTEQAAHGIHGTSLTAIITSASSGLGLDTTRVLALCGVHVVMAVRNVKNGLNIKQTLLKENPNAKIDVFKLDLSSLASDRKFVVASGLPLNIIVYINYSAYRQSKLVNILHANELACQ